MDEPRATMVDVAFALAGDALPREHRQALARALTTRLPWLAELPQAGVHRINVSAGAGPLALLSGRSRLTLRVPRTLAPALDELVGARLVLGDSRLTLGGPPLQRELLPHGTLYAHHVAAADDDEIGFLAAVDAELQQLGVACRRMCGRLQRLAGEDQPLPAFSLMLDGLSPGDALRMLEHGIGAHRLWGCGLFVPHKSAAAVGH
jgi:CRISPR-associated protein Cas6